MIGLSERAQILSLVDEAQAHGASQRKACELIGLEPRTLQRWRRHEGPLRADGRTQRQFQPPNKLTEAEREQMLAIANGPEFAHVPPSQFVPILAERGDYIASEASFYRVLRDAKQLTHRLPSREPTPRHKPRALSATVPNQLYSWDITYLKTSVQGIYLYLYLFVDLYSRKITGWRIHESENDDYASELLIDIARREGVEPNQLTLHSDNGSPMKGATLLATLQRLGIVPSYSRPAVSNDNPYSESLFRTLKYRPDYPSKPFQSIVQADAWVEGFVHWYNHHHRHSAIQFVTPAQRHLGLDGEILEQRQQTYRRAQQQHPQRWSGRTRNWQPVTEVLLNPDKKTTITEVKNAA